LLNGLILNFRSVRLLSSEGISSSSFLRLSLLGVLLVLAILFFTSLKKTFFLLSLFLSNWNSGLLLLLRTEGVSGRRKDTTAPLPARLFSLLAALWLAPTRFCKMNHARRFQARNLSRNECAQFGALEFLAERRHDFEGLAGYFYISSTLQLFKKGNITMGASQMHGIA
jgi:hypothetical protein